MANINLFYRKKKDREVYENEVSKIKGETSHSVNRGNVTATKVDITATNYDSICKEFIAFDTETTGLSADRDVIIEVGAVRFVDGEKTASYGTLVNEGRPVPKAASRINHITTEMLEQNGKLPQEAYGELVDFFDEVMSGSICVCAHNASFDMRFLTNTLERYGYSGRIKYIDTLTLSRMLIKRLPNYKQDTVAHFFDLENEQAHRAVSDAETCGNILNNLLHLKHSDIEKEKARIEKSKPNDEELEIAAIVLNSLRRNNCKIENIRFYKNSSNYIDVLDVDHIFKFKLGLKKRYFIIPKEYSQGMDNIEECTKTEGKDNIRLLFEDPFELEGYGEVLSRIYMDFKRSNNTIMSRYQREYLTRTPLTKINDEDINIYINSAKKRSSNEMN